MCVSGVDISFPREVWESHWERWHIELFCALLECGMVASEATGKSKVERWCWEVRTFWLEPSSGLGSFGFDQMPGQRIPSWVSMESNIGIRLQKPSESLPACLLPSP